jgi:hypothetical protein
LDGHNCIKCGVPLVSGKNWVVSNVRSRTYVCRKCRQVIDDEVHTPRMRQRERDRYDAFAVERGECADHPRNFGYHFLYSPEMRAVFQWDHRFGSKEIELSLHNFHRRISVLISETEKCALVCANCHSLATQRGWSEGAHWLVAPRRIDHSAE